MYRFNINGMKVRKIWIMKLVYRDDGYSRFSFGMGNHSNHRDIRLDIALSAKDWWHFTNGVCRVLVFTPIRGNFWLDAVSILRFVIFFFFLFFLFLFFCFFQEHNAATSLFSLLQIGALKSCVSSYIRWQILN